MTDRQIDKKAIEAQSNKTVLECFIKEQEVFILSCAYKSANRYITKSDDEWIIALEAFLEAVNNYSYEKGSFLSFSKLVIQRRLIDFFKKQSKYQSEILVEPGVFSGQTSGNDEENSAITKEVLDKTTIFTDSTIKEEIDAVTQQLKKYGFSFYDLISCSPKSKNTKYFCSMVCEYMVSNPILISEMRKTKTLPLKIIENNLKAPRKIIERHRKYIIAVVEIIFGDYPQLKMYLRTFREEHKK